LLVLAIVKKYRAWAVSPVRRRGAGRERGTGTGRERGVAAIEFALVALPFFTLIGAILETALLLLAAQILDTAVSDASRLIRTGQAQTAQKAAQNAKVTNPSAPDYNFKTEVCNRLYTLVDCANVWIEVSNPSSFGSATWAPPATPAAWAGTPAPSMSLGTGGAIVLVKAYYQYPLFFTQLGLGLNDSNGKRLLGAVTAFRNEPFPPPS
jgi:hypothetical protein